MIEPIQFSKISEPEINEINIEEFLVDPDIEVKEPIPILSVKEDGHQIPVFTEENISLLFGPAKSRKSTLIKSICQAVLNGDNEKMASNYQRNEIAIVDTEQSKYHCYRAVKAIQYLTNRKIKYYNSVGTDKYKKRELVELHLQQNPNCGLLILDNIVHFLKDFNSVDESAELTEWLIKTKKDYNVHILNVLHENASGGIVKPRGHLGTNLMNLCETIIKIEKDSNDNNYSVITAFLTRGRPFENFRLTMDYQGIPYLSEMEKYERQRY
jgi:hypothetical protein